MKTIQGDLIALAQAGQFDVIAHGCNCFHTMGAGIALAIRRTFPEAYAADRRTPYGEGSKVGSISCATVATASGAPLTVVNAYTQHNFRGVHPLVDYDGLRRAFQLIRAQFAGQRIGYPLIGAGLAGGDWATIAAIIDQELAGEDHTLVQYNPKEAA